MNSLQQVRKRIDKIDRLIIGLIGERAKCVKNASKYKHNIEQVKAPARVREVMRTRRGWAKSAGVSPDLIEGLYKRLVAHFIREEKKELGKQKDKRNSIMYYSKDKLKLKKDIMGAAMWAVAMDNAMLTYFEVKPFAEFKEHSHESEQITCVLEGELYFTTPDGTVKVRKGEVIAIPSNVVHTVFSKDKFVRAVDAWSPPMDCYREDEYEDN